MGIINKELIGQIVYSRCLELGHKPSELEFTKYLYLLDYCHYRRTGEKLSDIDWIFFHYGPWARSIPSIMAAVMALFPYGWRDLPGEYDAISNFDAVTEKMHVADEASLGRIIKHFKDRSVNDLIEWCYYQTEPMADARREEPLDFSKIKLNKDFPIFAGTKPPVAPPLLCEKAQKAADAYKARRLARNKDVSTVQADPDLIAAMEIANAELFGQDVSSVPKMHIGVGKSVDVIANFGSPENS